MSKHRLAWLTPETIPAGTTCRVLIVPDAIEWRGMVNGALALLTDAENFEEFGALTADEVAERFAEMYDSYLDEECVVLTANDLIIVEERQASGTNGGTFTAGAWRTRALNTEVLDTANIASVSSSRISLPAGTYRVNAVAGAYGVLGHRTRLYDVTAGAVIMYGINAYSPVWASSFDGGALNTSNALLTGQFTLAATSQIELQHYSQGTFATYGFGRASSLTTECYASVRLEKLP